MFEVIKSEKEYVKDLLIIREVRPLLFDPLPWDRMINDAYIGLYQPYPPVEYRLAAVCAGILQGGFL
jgi:hypothetical protein